MSTICLFVRLLNVHLRVLVQTPFLSVACGVHASLEQGLHVLALDLRLSELLNAAFLSYPGQAVVVLRQLVDFVLRQLSSEPVVLEVIQGRFLFDINVPVLDVPSEEVVDDDILPPVHPGVDLALCRVQSLELVDAAPEEESACNHFDEENAVVLSAHSSTHPVLDV